MDIFAYVDQRYLQATIKVVGGGAQVLTSPPIYAGDFRPGWLEGHEFVYVDLHGQPESVYLYSGLHQEWAALHRDTVRQADLRGTVVFATTCYLPETPFLRAFLEAGATEVVAGHEENFGARRRLTGAQRLAQHFLRGLERGRATEEAMARARAALLLNPLLWATEGMATRDALQFAIFHLEQEAQNG